MEIYIRETESKKVKTIVLDPDRAVRALKIFNRNSQHEHEATNKDGVPLNLD